MSIKPDASGSPYSFKARLGTLMIRAGYKNANDLARALYENNLVSVNSRRTDITLEEDIRKNAIGSIVKKVRKHMDAKDVNDVQGEYINAYCKLFICSADYLLGYSDVVTTDPSVREVCHLTGLSEIAVQNLIEEDNACLREMISVMLKDTQMTIEFSELWSSLISVNIRLARNNGYLEALDKILDEHSNERSDGVFYLRTFRSEFKEFNEPINDRFDSKLYRLTTRLSRTLEDSLTNNPNVSLVSSSAADYAYKKYDHLFKAKDREELSACQESIEELIDWSYS